MKQTEFDAYRTALLSGFCREIYGVVETMQAVNTQKNWEYLIEQMDYLAKLGEILEALGPYDYAMWPEFLDYEAIVFLVKHLHDQEDGLFRFLKEYDRSVGTEILYVERLSSVHIEEYLEQQCGEKFVD